VFKFIIGIPAGSPKNEEKSYGFSFLIPVNEKNKLSQDYNIFINPCILRNSIPPSKIIWIPMVAMIKPIIRIKGDIILSLIITLPMFFA